MKDYKPEAPPPCTCQLLPKELRKEFLDTGFKHFVFPGDVIGRITAPLRPLRLLLEGNSSESLFPPQSQWVDQVQESMGQFIRHNQIAHNAAQPANWDSADWAREQWDLHTLAAPNAPDDSHIQQLRDLLPPAVWHSEDHAPTKVVAFCPALYHCLVDRTFFGTPSVFAEEKLPLRKRARHWSNWYHGA